MAKYQGTTQKVNLHRRLDFKILTKTQSQAENNMREEKEDLELALSKDQKRMRHTQSDENK